MSPPPLWDGSTTAVEGPSMTLGSLDGPAWRVRANDKARLQWESGFMCVRGSATLTLGGDNAPPSSVRVRKQQTRPD
jgi:hypothetical protein